MKEINTEWTELANSFTKKGISPPSRKIPTQPQAIEVYFKEILHDISEKPLSFYDRNLRFKEDYGLDSLDKVEMVMYMEKDLNIKLYDHEWTHLKTAGQFLELLFARCLVMA
jgi:acyl carrier protein